ncbi:hypothetical protein F4555_000665 [Mobiluncus mulieris]|nr:hypothetical protein [Mobiluncus mulieris]
MRCQLILLAPHESHPNPNPKHNRAKASETDKGVK